MVEKIVNGQERIIEKTEVIFLTESVYNIKSMRKKTEYYNH